MKPKNVDLATIEARRFVKRAEEYLIIFRESHGDVASEREDDIHSSRESAAVKRASLDLTRALAMMRRRKYKCETKPKKKY